MPHLLPAKLNSQDDYLKYFENIAESSKLILHEPSNPKQKHFYTDYDDMVNSQATGTNLIAVAQPFHYRGQDYDNCFKIMSIELLFMRCVGEYTQKAVNDAITVCEAAWESVMGKLVYDSSLNRGLASCPFTSFKITDAAGTYLPEPNANDGWVGLSMTIMLGNTRMFNTYDSAQWR